MISGAENGPGEVTLTTVGDCPSSETLAAYLDGVLSQEERDAVELHLVSCDDCREAMSEASLALVEPQPAVDPVPFPAPTPTPTPSRAARPWLWPTVGLLAAAAVALAVAVPSYFRSKTLESRPELAELVAAVGPHRPFEPRLTGGFAYGPLAPVMRSAETDPMAVAPEIRLAAAKLAQRHEQLPTTRSTAARASGELVAGRCDAAVSLLLRATSEDPAEAAYWNDLAAAYLVRYSQRRDYKDADRALEAAENAISRNRESREARFNRALALEALGRLDDLAWDDYLRYERDSNWSQYVRQRRINASHPRGQ